MPSDSQDVLGACPRCGRLAPHRPEADELVRCVPCSGALSEAFPYSYVGSQYPDPPDWWTEQNGPERVYVVGCSGSKMVTAEPVRAESLYLGQYWEKRRRVAELDAEDWRILSAGHGLIRPDDEIHTYDRTIPNLSDEARDILVRAVARELPVGSSEWPLGVEIVILAGQDYVDVLRDALAAPGNLPDYRPHVRLRTPFEDTAGIGEQLGWLTDRLESLRPTEQTGLDKWGASA
jgi:hypothetical protein